MPTIQIPIIRGDKVSADVDYLDAIPVNMYAVNRPILGAKGYMIQYQGLTSFTIGVGQDRGAIYNERLGEQYRVSGTKLISVSAIGVVTELGGVSGTNQVSMPYSFLTQCVISSKRMFLYDKTNGFREVTDSDLGEPIDAVWANRRRVYIPYRHSQ
jgi:hypothetical protein